MEHQEQNANQRTINLTEETKKTADEFVGLVNGLFESIEELNTINRPMNEGEWLIMSNTLMKLHQFKDRFKTNVVVVEQVQRHQRGRVMNREKQTRQQKLADPLNMACPKCLRIITKRHYKEKHSLAGVCKATEVVAEATAKNAGEKPSAVRRIKISRVENIVFYTHTGRLTPRTQKPMNPAKTITSVFSQALNIGEVFKVKEVPDRPIDMSGSCEYSKNAEGKWRPVVKVKRTLKIKKPKKVKLVIIGEEEVSANTKNIKMSLCVKANNLKKGRHTVHLSAEQFKYLYGDYYSPKFMENINEECYFRIRLWYEDRKARTGEASVWCDMYWNIEDADMPNAEQFEDECNRIKYFKYNGSSGIAMTMSGLDYDSDCDDEDEE
jgi:hypothetical protein